MYERQSEKLSCSTGNRKQEPGVFVILAKRRFVAKVMLLENHKGTHTTQVEDKP